MGLLKKIGEVLLKGTEIITGLGPLLGRLFPTAAGVIGTVQNDLTLLGQAVVQAEAFGQALSLPGTDKLKGVIPAASQIFLTSELMRGKKIKDVAKYNAAVAVITGGVADLLSSLDDAVSTQSAT